MVLIRQFHRGIAHQARFQICSVSFRIGTGLINAPVRVANAAVKLRIDACYLASNSKNKSGAFCLGQPLTTIKHLAVRKSLAWIALLMVFCCTSVMNAATVTWTNNAGGTWATGANW